MNIQQILEEMKNIQVSLLNYIEDDTNIEENFQNLITTLHPL